MVVTDGAAPSNPPHENLSGNLRFERKLCLAYAHDECRPLLLQDEPTAGRESVNRQCVAT